MLPDAKHSKDDIWSTKFLHESHLFMQSLQSGLDLRLLMVLLYKDDQAPLGP